MDLYEGLIDGAPAPSSSAGSSAGMSKGLASSLAAMNARRKAAAAAATRPAARPISASPAAAAAASSSSAASSSASSSAAAGAYSSPTSAAALTIPKSVLVSSNKEDTPGRRKSHVRFSDEDGASLESGPGAVPTPLRPAAPASSTELLTADDVIEQEYDPAKPNDYQEFCQRRAATLSTVPGRGGGGGGKRGMAPLSLAAAAALADTDDELSSSMSRDRERDRDESLAELTRQREREARGGLPAGAERAARPGLGAMSAAEKMMANMGWKDGQGLGRHKQGIATPLIAKKVAGGQARIELGEQRDLVNTRILLLCNMVGRGEVDDDLAPETRAECEQFGKVLSCLVREYADAQEDEAVRIFVRFTTPQAVQAAIDALNGRFFGGRTVKAMRFSEKEYLANVLQVSSLDETGNVA